MSAEMAAARHAVATPSANYVSLTRNQLTRLEVVYIRSDFNDLADEFVANHHRHGNRLLRPLIPVEDVKVGAANSRSQDPNKDVIDADGGLGNVSQPQTRFSSGFDQSFHVKNGSRCRPELLKKQWQSDRSFAFPSPSLLRLFWSDH